MPGPITQRGLQVPFREVNVREGGSPSLYVAPDCQTATRTLRVAGTDLVTACQQLVGYSQLDDSDPDNIRIRRWLPAQMPLMPWCIAVRIARTRGVGHFRGGEDGVSYMDTDWGRIAVYPEADIDVEYTSVDYDLYDDTTLESMDGGYSEFNRFCVPDDDAKDKTLSFPENSWKWSQGSNAGGRFPGRPPKIECSREHRFRLLDWPIEAYPETAIRATVGRINKTEFDGAPPHTLLCVAVKRKRKNTPLGGRSVEMEVVILAFEPGHDKIFDFLANAPAYYQISADGVFYAPGTAPDGKLIFDHAEFTDLFKPEPARVQYGQSVSSSPQARYPVFRPE